MSDLKPRAAPSAEQAQIPSSEALQPHIDAGHELIPVDHQSKKPSYVDWTRTQPLSPDQARAHMAKGGNIGVRLRPDMLVIDVDPRNFANSVDSFDALMNGANIRAFRNWPVVRTGGGGWHYYLKKPADLAVVNLLPDFPGVEFKSAGRQVLAAGSVHPDTRRRYSLEPHPLFEGFQGTMPVPRDLLAMIVRQPACAAVEAGQHTPEEVAQLLTGLDVRRYSQYENWFRVMAAVHAASNGAAKEEFIAWCVGDPDYANDAERIGRSWAALDAERPGGITVRTLYRALKTAGRQDLVDLLGNPDDDGGELANWVWVADASVFIRRSDTKKYNKEQFKSMYAGLHPEGDILNAVWKGKTAVERFEEVIYLPQGPELVDQKKYNLWRPSGVEAREGDTSWFDEHLRLMFPDEQERDLVLDYLALLVQRPAEKIKFALLIQGAQGTGKSAIGALMRRVIGGRNVVFPSNDEVVGRFSGWQEGRQLAIINELMTLGRLEVANRLKTVITEPTLRIEEKYSTTYTIPNYLNLLCFTNHRNAVPIESGDRRWLVIFSPAKPQSGEYYDRLFGKIESAEGASAVKYYLSERQIALNPNGQAPETQAKREMRGYSIGEVEDWLKERFEDSDPPFDFPLVRLEDILFELPRDLKARQKNVKQTVTKFLRDELGAEQASRNTKEDGRRHYRLWIIRDFDKWREAGPTARIDAYEEQITKQSRPSSE